MAKSKSNASALAWKLAGQQHGIVTRRQLLALGFSPIAIEHRVSKRRLHLVMRGVYAVGWPRLTPKRRWMATVLACGDGACLSHRSAGTLWQICSEEAGSIDISVRRRCRIKRSGIRVRSRPSLPGKDVMTCDYIPVTDPVRTLVDLASELSVRSLERAINDADKSGLITYDELFASLEDFAGEPGIRPFRRLLDRHTFRLSDSDLEVLFRPIAESAGLPPPRTKARVNGFEVDFFWSDLGLVVETDGLRYHRTPATQARDRLRDQTHTATGLVPLRFTHWQVKHESARVRDVLERTIARLRAPMV